MDRPCSVWVGYLGTLLKLRTLLCCKAEESAGKHCTQHGQTAKSCERGQESQCVPLAVPTEAWTLAVVYTWSRGQCSGNWGKRWESSSGLGEWMDKRGLGFCSSGVFVQGLGCFRLDPRHDSRSVHVCAFKSVCLSGPASLTPLKPSSKIPSFSHSPQPVSHFSSFHTTQRPRLSRKAQTSSSLSLLLLAALSQGPKHSSLKIVVSIFILPKNKSPLPPSLS